MFKLSKEELQKIMEYYGGSKGSIHKIESVLNSIELIKDEEDYKELIINIVMQAETNKLLKAVKSGISFKNLSEIIANEVIRKYEITDQKIR